MREPIDKYARSRFSVCLTDSSNKKVTWLEKCILPVNIYLHNRGRTYFQHIPTGTNIEDPVGTWCQSGCQHLEG